MNRKVLRAAVLGLPIVALSLLLHPTPALAGGFVMPLDRLDGTTDTIVLLPNGKVVTGQVKVSVLMNGHLRSFVIQDPQGNKHKLKAAEVDEVRNKISGLTKWGMKVSQGSTLNGLLNADWDSIVNREYAIFVQALLPGKKERYALLALINPGFDARIRVFVDPNANESASFGDSFLTSGSDDLSYLAAKDGGQTVKVKKASYKKKDFAALFGDCEPMMNHPELGNIKFEFFAEHVAVYDQQCGKDGSK